MRLAQVRNSLDESSKASRDMKQAITYIRQISTQQQDERDASLNRVSQLEEEVATLQRRIHALETEKAALTNDKATLAEANRKVIAQLNQVFSFGQAVQTGLAFQGLTATESGAGASNATAVAPVPA